MGASLTSYLHQTLSACGGINEALQEGGMMGTLLTSLLPNSPAYYLTHQLTSLPPHSPASYLTTLLSRRTYFRDVRHKGLGTFERSLRSEWLILNHCLKVVAGFFAGGISGERE